MQVLDWVILFGTLLFIVLYGLYKTRKIKTSEDYLRGERDLPWWMIGLSIMATQASAITFLSTPGQAYESGMSFVQFYFGLPLAMVILSIFFLPYFYKLKVYTAYEFLEGRFDLKTRTLTSFLFLIQRGLAAGLTIFAPAIILSTILGWDLRLTNLIIGILAIVYTVAGGTEAVSQTHKQQMFVIMVGMVLAFFLVIYQLPDGVDLSGALHLASAAGKMNILSTEFDLSNKYNIWTGFLGGTFLFLSYFGTDQSQVQRYIGGKNLKQGRLGLMFNALAKIPMQFFILLTGVLVFVFFQFTKSPLHFNPTNEAAVYNSEYQNEYRQLKEVYSHNFQLKEAAAMKIASSENPKPQVLQNYNEYLAVDQQLREKAQSIIRKANSSFSADDVQDTDYVFITYVLKYFPVGMVGLLLAVIFSAAMSSIAAELNALSTTTMVDVYQRHFKRNASDKHYLNMSKVITIFWGLMALTFAMVANLFNNLIEAVNIIGSLFYGTILGVFVVAFFIKWVKGKSVFWAAVISELIILSIFYFSDSVAYLWLNAFGCGFVVIISLIIQGIGKLRK